MRRAANSAKSLRVANIVIGDEILKGSIQSKNESFLKERLHKNCACRLI